MARPQFVPDGFPFTFVIEGKEIGKSIAKHCKHDANGVAQDLYWDISCPIPENWAKKLNSLPQEKKAMFMEKLFLIKPLEIFICPNIINWHAGSEVRLQDMQTQLEIINSITTTKDPNELNI